MGPRLETPFMAACMAFWGLHKYGHFLGYKLLLSPVNLQALANPPFLAKHQGDPRLRALNPKPYVEVQGDLVSRLMIGPMIGGYSGYSMAYRGCSPTLFLILKKKLLQLVHFTKGMRKRTCPQKEKSNLKCEALSPTPTPNPQPLNPIISKP